MLIGEFVASFVKFQTILSAYNDRSNFGSTTQSRRCLNSMFNHLEEASSVQIRIYYCMLLINLKKKTENISAIAESKSKVEKAELNDPYYLFSLRKSQEQIWLFKYKVNLRKVPKVFVILLEFEHQVLLLSLIIIYSSLCNLFQFSHKPRQTCLSCTTNINYLVEKFRT